MNSLQNFIQEKLIINKNIQMEGEYNDISDKIIDTLHKPDYIVKSKKDIKNIYKEWSIDNKTVEVISEYISNKHYPLYCYILDDTNSKRFFDRFFDFRNKLNIDTQKLAVDFSHKLSGYNNSFVCMKLYDPNSQYFEIFLSNTQHKEIFIVIMPTKYKDVY